MSGLRVFGVLLTLFGGGAWFFSNAYATQPYANNWFVTTFNSDFAAQVSTARNVAAVTPWVAAFGIGLVLVSLVRPTSGEAGRVGTQTSSGEPTRACPFCAEQIKYEAIKCRYCGSEVPSSTPPVTDSMVMAARSSLNVSSRVYSAYREWTTSRDEASLAEFIALLQTELRPGSTNAATLRQAFPSGNGVTEFEALLQRKVS